MFDPGNAAHHAIRRGGVLARGRDQLGAEPFGQLTQGHGGIVVEGVPAMAGRPVGLPLRAAKSVHADAEGARLGVKWDVVPGCRSFVNTRED